jgi:type I restriction enzyme S subunit
LLRITDIQEGRVDWSKVPGCSIEPGALDKFRLGSGDIVFARSGATTGKSFLIQNCPQDAVFASYLIRLRIRESATNSKYLAFFLQSPRYWQFISQNVAGIAQPNCNASKLATLELPLAPLAEQERIVEEVERRLSVIDEVETLLAANRTRADRVRQAILKRAFEGKLVPQDPRDEPATVLVERIRAQWRAADVAARSKKKSLTTKSATAA